MKPAYLNSTDFTAELYNAAIVGVRSVNQKAFYVLSYRIMETIVAARNGSRPWHQMWTLDLIIEAMKEIYDPHRFDNNVEK